MEVIEYEYPDTPAPLDIPKYCINCDISDAIYKCSACKQVYYCSEACQRQHWKQHKKFCGKESSICNIITIFNSFVEKCQTFTRRIYIW